MMNEQNQGKFQDILQNFLLKYRAAEPAFHRYFHEYYSSRTGKMKFFNLSKFKQCMYFISEKWAMCFRKFDHSDVDTNMHIER